MASSVALLPSINRNLSQVLDINDLGLVAYGARCSIYVLNFKTVLPVVIDSKLVSNAHRGRVMSLSFCKISGNELIASVGEDFILKIWDLETETCIASLEVKEQTRIVEWLHDSVNSMVFPDTHGYVTKWNFRTNNLVRMKTCSETLVYVLSSNKDCPELVAAGHSAGSISILNVNNQVLVHKLKAHVMDITSLSWSPFSPTILLSVSVDQTARIWKLGEDKPVGVHSYSRSRNKQEDKKNMFKPCGVFHPDKPDTIICTCFRGDVGEITFKENEMPKFISYDGRNSDTAFKSVNLMKPYVAENNKKLLLTSDHLKLSLWDLSEQKFLSSFAYVVGNIYELSASTISPNLLAVGVGDGSMKIWNLSEQSKLEMTTIVIYTRIKIMSLAWHPTVEGIIGYGTDEGRVGIADINKKRSLYSFETHHNNAVYTMQWAPCFKIKDSQEEYFLYSCGGGVIYIHELSKPKEKPSDFDDLITFPPNLELIQKTHSEMSWKSDYSCVLVGSFKGFVDIFDYQLNFLARVALQIKLVECLKWHPSYTFTSPNGSVYSSWFAGAGNDDNVHIYDSSEITKGDSESVICKPTKVLSGHKKRISSLCWSPHTDGHMVSGSRDGTVLVWNVISSTVLAKYLWHRDLIYAVHWSMFDPDVIYSGGMDNCLRVWKISEQMESALPEKCQVIKRKGKMKSKPVSRKENPDDNMNPSYKEICQSKGDSLEIVGEIDAEQKKDLSSKGISERSTKSKDLKEQKRTLFYDLGVKSKEKNLENILKLTDLLSNQSDSSDLESVSIADKVCDEDSLYCGLFCDQLTAVKMLETRAVAETETGHLEKGTLLQLMANNVEPLLTASAEKKQLTDFLVSAAITVSRKFYNEICEKYAVQLIEEKQYLKASMYLLFCGELYEAIKLLLEKEKVLEALSIAKARLPERDPFLHGVLIKAANYFSTRHQVENEAACYLALKEPSQAARTLYRIDDSKSIYASLYICYKFNLKEELESYEYLCLEKCLAQNDWPTFYEAVKIVDSLKVYKVLVRVHELIHTEIKMLKKEGLNANDIFGVTGSKLLIWKSRSFGDSNHSFLSFVYDVLRSDNFLPDDRKSLEEIHNALVSMDVKRKKYENSEEAHISLAIYVAQIIVTSLLSESNLVTEYFVKVFPAAYNIVFLTRVMYWLLFPLDIYWSSNENTFLCENNFLGSELLPFTKQCQDIYKSVSDKFASVAKFSTEDFHFNHDILANSNDVVEQVQAVLSKKTREDSLLLYFAICFLTELKKMAKNGWKFRCYSGLVDDMCENTKEVVDESGSVSVETSTAKKDSTQSNGSSSPVKEELKNNLNHIITQGSIYECKIPSSNVEAEDAVSLSPKKSLDNAQDKTLVKMDCDTKKNNLSENVNGSFESVTSSVKIEADVNDSEMSTSDIGGEVGGTEISSEVNGHKIEQNSSSDCINQELEIKESFSDSDDDHLQCWSDISLYYVLTECFASVVCKDEYSVLYCMQKFLAHLDNTIADLVRQKSTQSVFNGISSKVSGIKKMDENSALKNNDSNLIGRSNNLENNSDVPNSLKCEDIRSANENQLTVEDKVEICDNGQKCEVAYEDKVNTLDEGDSETIDVPNEKIEKNCSNQTMSQKLQAEHKILHGKVNLLNTVAFHYPNPFDAVSAVNGICCEIFRKHPCKLVKKKFHEFMHKMYKWNQKFCLPNETLKCDICQDLIIV